MRVFVDSSTIIALAQIGELDLLKKFFEKVYITDIIKKEILNPLYPETEIIENAIDNWIFVVKVDDDLQKYKKYGLDNGEASLFLALDKNKDRLIVDEQNARKLAEIERINFSGVLGIIIAATLEGKIEREKALNIVDKLVKSSFRMSVELYQGVLEVLNQI